MRHQPRSAPDGLEFEPPPTWSTPPFFAILAAVRRLAIGAAVIALLFSQIGGYIGVLRVDHLRLFELVGAGAAFWGVLLILVPWERCPVVGLMGMSMAATLPILAMVALSGGPDSSAWISYVLVAVFNVALTCRGITIGSDVRAAERHRLVSAVARKRLADADRWADRLEAIQQIGGKLHQVTSVPDLGMELLGQTARVVPFDAGRFAVFSGGAMVDLAVLDDASVDGSPNPEAGRTQATVAIVYEGQRLGRLVLERSRNHPFTPADRRLLSIVATFAASAVSNARLFEQARYDAERDALTGLLNRRAGLAALTAMIARGLQDGRSFAACMLDLDGFKRCNDRFGHPAGDDVLRDVAQRLLMVSRDDDVVARYGGDEFLVIFPNVNDVEASELSERMRAAVASSPVSPVPGALLAIDVSVGIALFPQDGDSAAALIAGADRSLYGAKGTPGISEPERFSA